MNYLAHIFLSGDDPEVLVGNLLEDFTKGRIDHERNNHLSEKVKWGLELHRLIDTHIDTSLKVKKAKVFFYAEFGKYTPAVLDILFDYFLIKNWDKYTSIDFNRFRALTYDALRAQMPNLPDPMKTMVKSMLKHDWLLGYGDPEKLTHIMHRFSAKVGKDIDFSLSIPIMLENKNSLDAVFNDFFPEMINICNTFLKSKFNTIGS